MSKLRYRLSYKNKIDAKFQLVFFLDQNGTYLEDTPRISVASFSVILVNILYSRINILKVNLKRFG